MHPLTHALHLCCLVRIVRKRRCHRAAGGARPACCQNVQPPNKLRNEHNFCAKWVNAAAKLIHKWFHDSELGMCRVVRMGGALNSRGSTEPVMFYTHVNEEGKVEEDSSSLPEVKR
jgi:hypothetical protein